MKLGTQKLLLSLSCLLWVGLVYFVCVSRFDISHSLSHVIDARSPPTRLTAAFALPILGGDAAGGLGKPLFYTVWTFLFSWPIGGLIWILKAEKAEVVSTRFMLLSALYLPVALAIAWGVGFGLWAPFLSL